MKQKYLTKTFMTIQIEEKLLFYFRVARIKPAMSINVFSIQVKHHLLSHGSSITGTLNLGAYINS